MPNPGSGNQKIGHFGPNGLVCPGFRPELKSLCGNRLCAQFLDRHEVRCSNGVGGKGFGVWIPLMYVSKWDANI